jgi:homeobox protein cut-like
LRDKVKTKTKEKHTHTHTICSSSILKSIEFPSTNRSNDDQTTNIPKKSLEILLLEKNRALQSEQTQIKVAHADLESKS